MIARDIPPTMDPAIVAQIDERLANIRRDENLAIPLAIESGSRAWGGRRPIATMIAGSFLFAGSINICRRGSVAM